MKGVSNTDELKGNERPENDNIQNEGYSNMHWGCTINLWWQKTKLLAHVRTFAASANVRIASSLDLCVWGM